VNRRVRAIAVLGLASALGLLMGRGAGSTFAAFRATTSNSADIFAAAPDWVAPTVSTTVIGKTAGGTPGFIRQGGTYNVYANVADAGNPPSGISTVAANVSAISAGQTVVALVAGSFSIGGVTYNYRSGSVTANAVLAAGSYTYSITSTDVVGNSRTQSGFTVTVDNTAPAGSDVQTANVGGGTVGHPELGDTMTITFTEPIDPNSVLATWTGASTNVVVRILNNNPDTVQVWNATNTVQLPVGTVNLANNAYVAALVTFGASGTPSTMVMSGSTITVTLGTASGATGTAGSNGTMTWPPTATLTDRAGNACSTATVTESGAADRDF
jgi:hypothetical protein